MTLATAELARSMGLSESELMQQALKDFVHEKRREVLQVRLEILARYQVDSVTELEKRIAEGQVAEHPGWEDLITVENLDVRLEELNAYLSATAFHHWRQSVNPANPSPSVNPANPSLFS